MSNQQRIEAISKLKELKDTGDDQAAHIKADQILCDLLKSLGFDKVVNAYEAIGKWYA